MLPNKKYLKINENVRKVTALATMSLAAVTINAFWRAPLDNNIEFSTVAGSQNEIYDNRTINIATYKPYPNLLEEADPIPTMTARSFLVYDVDASKILAGLNIEQPQPVASLTKLTTALLASRHLDPYTVITVPYGVVENLPRPVIGLQPGQKIMAADLAEAMLISSANDAAELIAYAAGEGDIGKAIDMMNALAEEVGLQKSHFSNATGFDDPEAYSTALDLLALILELKRTPWLVDILKKPHSSITTVDENTTFRFANTNQLLRTAINVEGGKTGYTPLAKGNLFTFSSLPNGGTMITVVLGSEHREQETLQLIDWILRSYQW